MSFTLPELPYAYTALEPHIDALTMGDSSQSPSSDVCERIKCCSRRNSLCGLVS